MRGYDKWQVASTQEEAQSLAVQLLRGDGW